MEPIVVYSHRHEGYVIYLRPGYQQTLKQLERTHREVFDKIERAKVAGGVPIAIEKVDLAPFRSKDAALRALKTLP